MEFRVGLPWELPYVDHLAVIADFMKQVIGKLNIWNYRMV